MTANRSARSPLQHRAKWVAIGLAVAVLAVWAAAKVASSRVATAAVAVATSAIVEVSAPASIEVGSVLVDLKAGPATVMRFSQAPWTAWRPKTGMWAHMVHDISASLGGKAQALRVVSASVTFRPKSNAMSRDNACVAREILAAPRGATSAKPGVPAFYSDLVVVEQQPMDLVYPREQRTFLGRPAVFRRLSMAAPGSQASTSLVLVAALAADVEFSLHLFEADVDAETFWRQLSGIEKALRAALRRTDGGRGVDAAALDALCNALPSVKGATMK